MCGEVSVLRMAELGSCMQLHSRLQGPFSFVHFSQHYAPPPSPHILAFFKAVQHLLSNLNLLFLILVGSAPFDAADPLQVL